MLVVNDDDDVNSSDNGITNPQNHKKIIAKE